MSITKCGMGRVAFWAGALVAEIAAAAPFTPGNILVSNMSSNWGDPAYLYEYTPAGSRVREVQIPIDGSYSNNSPRDLVVDRNGNAQIWVDIWAARLTQYDPVTGQTSNRYHDGAWKVANVTYYGGVAIYDRYVFVNSQEVVYGGAPGGIIRFDLDANTSTKFAGTDDSAVDLTVGFDGVLYSLGPASSPGRDRLYRYDPVTLTSLGTVALAASVKGVAVDARGHIFGTGDSQVYEFSPTGAILNEIGDPGIGGWCDIDLNRNGQILVTSHGGTISITDTSLASLTSFGTRSARVANAAWVQTPVPEPSTIGLLVLPALVALRSRCWR